MALTIILFYIIILLTILLTTFYDRSQSNFKKLKQFLLKKKSREKLTVNDIPGPRKIPLFGTKWIYLWKYKMSKIHEAYINLNKIYGDIMLEVSPFGFPLVNLYNRLDIEKVLKYPSKYPFRPPTEIAVFYRKSKPDRYVSYGIANEQGPNWLHLRSNLTSQITSPRVLQSFLPILNTICDDFIDLIRHTRDPATNIVSNFENLTNLLGLEASCTVMLGRRMGFLSKDFDSNKNGKIFKLAMAVKNLFITQRDSYFGFGMWKYVPTKTYSDFSKSEEIIYDVISEIVENSLKEEELDSNDNDIKSVFFSILQMSDLDIRDKKSAIIDFIAAGIETLGNTLSFIFYYLSKHKICQEKIAHEFEFSQQEIKHDQLTKSIYTKACIQETYRICPTAFCIARILEEDMTLAGYHLPTGTVVLCHTYVACHSPANFKNPDKYEPERWINDENKVKSLRCNELGSSVVLPFGVGKRTCPGKRFVEMELLLIVAKMIKEFNIDYIGEVDTQFEFLLAPKSPISIRFNDNY